MSFSLSASADSNGSRVAAVERGVFTPPPESVEPSLGKKRLLLESPTSIVTGSPNDESSSGRQQARLVEGSQLDLDVPMDSSMDTMQARSEWEELVLNHLLELAQMHEAAQAPGSGAFALAPQGGDVQASAVDGALRRSAFVEDLYLLRL